jgi:hypothetical protein
MMNFVLMGLAIAFILHTPSWLKQYAFINKEILLLKGILISALIGIPGAGLIRNRRRALIAGNSACLSQTQFPEIYAILTEQCRHLGMTYVPELYLTVGGIRPFSAAFSSWHKDFIVIHQIGLDVDYTKSLDIMAFAIAHELGRIRLNHTAWWNDILLTYITATTWLINPLKRIRVYSRDRYGAYLAPAGFRGLLIYAVGRRLMPSVNVDDFLDQATQYQGLWADVTMLTEPIPPVLQRLRALHVAGFKLELPRPAVIGDVPKAEPIETEAGLVEQGHI